MGIVTYFSSHDAWTRWYVSAPASRTDRPRRASGVADTPPASRPPTAGEPPLEPPRARV